MSNYSETEEMIIISLITISENCRQFFIRFDGNGQTNPLPFRGDSLMFLLTIIQFCIDFGKSQVKTSVTCSLN